MKLLLAAYMIGVGAEISTRSIEAAIEVMAAALIVALMSSTRIT